MQPCNRHVSFSPDFPSHPQVHSDGWVRVEARAESEECYGYGVCEDETAGPVLAAETVERAATGERQSASLGEPSRTLSKTNSVVELHVATAVQIEQLFAQRAVAERPSTRLRLRLRIIASHATVYAVHFRSAT